MRKMRSLLAPLAFAVVSLSGCSADVATGVADNAIYNGTYVGQGTIQSSPTGYSAAAPEPAVVTLTLSTIGSDFGGTLVSTLKSGQYSYRGNVSGRVTPYGGSFTYIQSTCEGTLYGSFTLSEASSVETLSGSAVGRDCDAGASGDNVRITFTNLVRQ